MCRSLEELESRALLVFHAYSGCHTTSTFSGKSKKSAWQAYDDGTKIFVSLAKHPFQHLDVDCQQFQKLERLTVIVYDKSSPLSSLIRQGTLLSRVRAMERLPPPQDALLQHCKWAVGYIKQGFGQPAHNHSKWFLLHTTLDGPGNQGHGCLFGWPFQKSPEHAHIAESWWNDLVK